MRYEGTETGKKGNEDVRGVWNSKKGVRSRGFRSSWD